MVFLENRYRPVSQVSPTQVPLNHTKFPKLGLWVKEQRRHYTLMKQGKQSHMTFKRAEELNNIGFCWDTHEATWLERLRELTLYAEKHGDCIVPTNYLENPKVSSSMQSLLPLVFLSSSQRSLFSCLPGWHINAASIANSVKENLVTSRKNALMHLRNWVSSGSPVVEDSPLLQSQSRMTIQRRRLTIVRDPRRDSRSRCILQQRTPNQSWLLSNGMKTTRGARYHSTRF